MGLGSFLNRIKCKILICCNSKCSLNDVDNNGKNDTFSIETIDGEKILQITNV